MPNSKKRRLRSEAWLNDPSQPDQTAIYIERYLNFGMTREELQSGKPIIGIAQTGSDLSPCNRHHLELAKRVRDGIRDAGGIPMEFPVHIIHEMAKRPTAALDRNLTFLSLVEILYGYPLDGVVLTTGCDKTTPALIMGAALVDIPAIVLSGGPMLNGYINEGDGEQRAGSGMVIWDSREKLAAGKLNYDSFMDRVASSATSTGHCNTMGTALTMNCIAEALGMSLPRCGAIPGPYRERAQIAFYTGKRIVDMVHKDLKPSDILSRNAFLNAIAVTTAIGGSTNAPPHLQAIANQAGVELSLKDWQSYGENVPQIVNCQPAGEYLGEDFHRAGGLPAVIAELSKGDYLQSATVTVTGKSLLENCAGLASENPLVITSINQPVKANAGFAVMSGNLFDSALMKKSVISHDFSKRYLQSDTSPNAFEGRAIVFEGPEDYHARINDPDLAIDVNCILVIRYCGPLAYPGSAEVVNMLPPDALVKQGITSLPCLGDGRQSGTSASPSILNACPEAADGGGLALLKTGDMIEIDLNKNSVNVTLSEQELAERRRNWQPPTLINQTPWQEIYRERVTQLDQGGDLKTESKFYRLHATHGIPRNSH